jgi:phenylacetaldehyde dehydrogenase
MFRVEGRHEVGTVNLVEIDVVGAQPRKAVFDGAHDVSAGQADSIRSRARSSPHLGSDDHIASRDGEILDGAAQDSLRLAFEAGIPDGVVNIVTGFGETAGAALAEHPDVDKVAFTGLTEVGKLIVKAAAENLKRVPLELGGKSPAIVFPDADLDRAIAGTADAIFFNQGQCCTAGSRLFAHKSVYDKVVEGMVGRAGKIKVGHGLDPSVELGPLVSKEQHTRVTGYIESGRQQGATVATGGHVIGNQGYFVEPTVLVKTDRSMRVVREEIFGPVVCVQSFDDDDLDAVAKFANDTEYGLQASVWTRNLKVAHTMARKIKAGTICIDSHNYGDPAWPFGGYKQSGWGREMGKGSHGKLHGDEICRR